MKSVLVGSLKVASIVFGLYVFVVLSSLAAIANGADIAYMPFWHGPIRWLVSLFIGQ